jgi:hypothetical protein
MAEVHFYHPMFNARAAQARRVRGLLRTRTQGELIDLEFSNYGRSPRFQHGWYILPALVTGMAIIAAVLLIV